MCHMKIFYSLVMTVILLTLIVPAVNAKDKDVWTEIYPNRFDRVEAFFLDNDCEFYQNAAFVYDTGAAKFLSKMEVKEILPSSSDLFMQHGCTIEVSPQKLGKVLSYDSSLPENTNVILFFDLPVGKDGGSVTQILSDALKVAYKERVAGLSRIEGLKKYKVITSLNGYHH